MGLSIVASFLDPTEAKVAAGALCSAGFNAVVLDQNFSSVDWIARQSLGGIRIGVPDAELVEAAQFLRSAIAEQASQPDDPDQHDQAQAPLDPHPGGLWPTAAMVFGVILPLMALMVRPEKTWEIVVLVLGGLGAPLGWLIAAAGKSRGRRGQLTAMLSTILLLAGVAAALFAITTLVDWLSRLLYAHGRG